MGTNNDIEIIVHVDDELGAGHRYRVVDSLQAQSGITEAHFTPNRPHLMVVDYDPAEINAVDVLNHVKAQRLSAVLIGGV
ncbi:MAG TPA: ATP-binding protein [Chromatiaceae bacterium]|jgi:hypothetical protein|nr:ATP-binding protein [Chromatiaceae bacterium]HIN83128.1 ATP-binding protein [Chromatiales bacterium]HIA08268.1 ATP-binding protein [Chromatiaceae bacterium]HIB84364.1 ATP-binding protein [Chromatiaceae bacterium]HIO14154.1 ATP-binding protein [Chromatiales bacterium]